MEKMSHTERIENAIACKSVDRTAYQNLDGGLIGQWISDEFQIGDMYLRPEWAMDKIIEAGKKMGGDTAPVYFYGPIMAMDFTGVYYKTPGRELPADTCFEAIETNPMKDECLDFILENGVQAYIDKYVVPNWPEWAYEEGEKGGALAGLYAESAWHRARTGTPCPSATTVDRCFIRFREVTSNILKICENIRIR